MQQGGDDQIVEAMLFRMRLRKAQDEHLQQAIIRDLAQLSGPHAVSVIAECLLQLEPQQIIDVAINALVDCAADGGLLALTSTLLVDCQTYRQKLRAMARGAANLDRDDIGRRVQALATYRQPLDEPLLAAHLASLAQVPQADIQYGAVIAALLAYRGPMRVHPDSQALVDRRSLSRLLPSRLPCLRGCATIR
jgi:hypothetical protein